MDQNEMLLVLTVCELLGQSKTPKEIEKAYQNAMKVLDDWNRRKGKSR